MVTIKPQHQRTIDRLTEHFTADPNYLALIVGGSIVRGWEREDSDVDIILVATDEELARRKPTRSYHYFTFEFCDYPGGYVDGKIVDRAFLEEVADHGSEPARNAFVNAFASFSRIDDLNALLQKISAYPEDERQRKIESFYAQVQALQWYIGEAEKRADRYLMTHVVADLVLFGGRLILAHNRLMYPYHKWFLTLLAEAPEKPAGLLEMIAALLAEPGKATADPFCEAVLKFTDWSIPAEGWPARFMEDSEWNWRYGRPPVTDW